MDTTKVFKYNIAAYYRGEKLIINQGGTSSSKTYSILQLLFAIAHGSKEKLIISVVSYALPHLKLGAIRDFENILISQGINVDSVKNKSDLYYKINNSIIEFFSSDNAKAHGARRNILYINECNLLKHNVFEQLEVRTKDVIFLDYNPVSAFWVHEKIIPFQKHKLIKSTYKDNTLLDKNIVDRIESKKSNENWWRVYGLGEIGRFEGTILSNWKFGEFDNTLAYCYGLDFGVKDPDAMTKVAIDSKKKIIYIEEILYKTGLSTGELIEFIKQTNTGNKLIVADSASPRTILDIAKHNINIVGAEKNKIISDIKNISEYLIVISENSFNLQKELNNWIWLDKKGEIPCDYDNHLIDSIRYAFVKLTKVGTVKKTKFL